MLILFHLPVDFVQDGVVVSPEGDVFQKDDRRWGDAQHSADFNNESVNQQCYSKMPNLFYADMK